MAPPKSRKSETFPISDTQSANQCSEIGQCQNADCPNCAPYRQRILPKQEEMVKKEPLGAWTAVLDLYERGKTFITVTVCIIASFVVVRRSKIIPTEQLFLECILHGLYNYVSEKSLFSSAITMIGGCGVWYFNSAIKNEYLTILMLNCLQGISAGTRKLVIGLALYHVTGNVHVENLWIKMTVFLGVVVLVLELFNKSLYDSFPCGVEDAILLLPVYNAVSYLNTGHTYCQVLGSLLLGLVWILAKEYRIHKIRALEDTNVALQDDFSLQQNSE